MHTVNKPNSNRAPAISTGGPKDGWMNGTIPRPPAPGVTAPRHRSTARQGRAGQTPSREHTTQYRDTVTGFAADKTALPIFVLISWKHDLVITLGFREYYALRAAIRQKGSKRCRHDGYPSRDPTPALNFAFSPQPNILAVPLVAGWLRSACLVASLPRGTGCTVDQFKHCQKA